MKIKKGDNVKVMRGKDAGKSGQVMAVVHRQNRQGVSKTRVIVQGVNIVKKHRKPNPTLNIPGGIVEVEKPIDISNVMLIDAKTKMPTRVNIKIDEKTGRKIRVTQKSKQEVTK